MRHKPKEIFVKREPEDDQRAARPFSRIACLVVALSFVVAGAAFAVGTGLQNGSFEEDLTGWSASTVRYDAYNNRTVVYAPDDPRMCTAGNPYGICVVGEDRFTVRDHVYDNASGDWNDVDREVVVTPNDGSKMLRLGGPFLNSGIGQSQDLYRVTQQFTVSAEEPVLQLNFNAFTWDYEGFDQIEFRVRVTDENGAVIARTVQGAFGEDISLKTTGWLPASIDLTGYEGQNVMLEIESGGTWDTLYGFWAYVDAGFSAGDATPDPVVNPPKFPGGGEVPVGQQENANGDVWFTVGNSSVGQFPSSCMPLGMTVPIDPGAATTSNVSLILKPQLPGQPAGSDQSFAMTKGDGNNWTTEITCVKTGSLFLKYDLTETDPDTGKSVTQTFVIPIGGITLIDPQGVVYDKAEYDADLPSRLAAWNADPANESDPERPLSANCTETIDPDTGAPTNDCAEQKGEARTAAAIEGATVRLQRKVDGTFVNVLSGDPGISPKVNPQTTGENGLYQWDVSAGDYRVQVAKNGYTPVTSNAVTIPEPKFDLHIAMEKEAPNLPDTTITSGPGNGSSTTDDTPTFQFTSSPSGATFECRVNGSGSTGWSACTSPRTIGPLANGSHTFEVRAKNTEGVDASPANSTFTVAKPSGGDDGGKSQPADTDGDGFADSSDACPTQPGTPPNGCPKVDPVPNDSDGDGIADSSDQCPTQAGPSPSGCPQAEPKGDPACFGLSGQRRATCKWLEKQKASCAKKSKGKGKAKAKKGALCVKRAKALAKCQSIGKAKKRKQCVAKAKKIGAPKPKKGKGKKKR